MTAEIAIANANAIAVAADSAVTINSGSKIYNSAIKMFTLSKFEPVGAMIYGSAGLMNVPWETILKVYRAELGHQTFGKLEDYAVDLRKFLARSSKFFPKEIQIDWMKRNIAGFYKMIGDELVEKVDVFCTKNSGITIEQSLDILKEIVSHHRGELKALSFATGFEQNMEKRLRKQIVPIAKPVLANVFEERVKTRTLRSWFFDIATMLHTRDIYSNGISGLVVAGFGSDDIYPAFTTSEIEGRLSRQLKFRERPDKSFRVNHPLECSIVPFAQEDMVATFMNGMSPAVETFFSSGIRHLMSKFPDAIPEKLFKGNAKTRAQTHSTIRDGAGKLAETFLKELSAFARSEQVDPVLSMVRSLPKDELASMAEALVNLTAFKRRITDQLETVGGPVDVAVISKGDGLVWVKRKHYFPPDLNQQFFSNYYGGPKNGK